MSVMFSSEQATVARCLAVQTGLHQLLEKTIFALDCAIQIAIRTGSRAGSRQLGRLRALKGYLGSAEEYASST